VVVSAQAYSCQQCGGKATWHPERRAMACQACGTTLELPPAPTGDVPWFPLVPRLRDAPENRRTWTPKDVTAPCPACGGPVIFPANLISATCDGCGTPIVRGATPDDAPLAPDGVIPFAIGEAEAERLFRAWAVARDGARLGRTVLSNITVQRTYVAYWAFSVHVHCPYRGEYDKTTRDGHAKRVVFGGTIDETYSGITRGFAHLPPGLLRRIEPMPIANARPYDARYLTGAIVEQYTLDLWTAWDAVRAIIDKEVDDTLKAAGDGDTLPAETWPTWSQHRGRLVLAPVHVLSYTALGDTFTVLVDGTSGQVHGHAPTTWQNRLDYTLRLGVVWLGGLVTAALLLWWLVPSLVELGPALLPGLIRALLS
jgi:hypothetical protein